MAWLPEVRMRGWSLLCGVMLGWMTVAAAGGTARRDRGVREERKVASDGVTEGWMLTYDNPDPDRAWERIGGALVVARHGKVVRRWDVTVRRWAFWAGGREVAYEAGPLHGPGQCFLVSVKTGKQVTRVPGDCDEERPDAPDWAKALVME